MEGGEKMGDLFNKWVAQSGIQCEQNVQLDLSYTTYKNKFQSKREMGAVFK